MVGDFDLIVSEGSAAGFPRVDRRAYLSAGHKALAKPVSRLEALADLILQELRAHKLPRPVLDRIRNLKAHEAAFDDYVRRYQDAVGEVVAFERPHFSEEARAIKTASLLLDFLHEFPERPLRGVDFDEALVSFVTRKLQGEY